MSRLTFVGALCGALLLVLLWWIGAPRRPTTASHGSHPDTGARPLVARPSGPPEWNGKAAESPPGGSRTTVVPGAAEGPTGEAALAVSVVWGVDGAPASGIYVSLLCWGEAQPFLGERSAVTDEGGTARFARLPSGSASVSLDRSDGTVVRLVAGQETRVSLAIPSGITVEGLVLGPREKAVAGGSIWLSEYANGTRGSVVGHADARGRFRLRDVGEGRTVAAFAPGLAPSAALAVRGQPGETVTLTLRHPAEGGALRGVVRGPAGELVPGALVLLGDERSRTIASEGGASAATAPPRRLRTDGDGRFSATGLTPGALSVQVRAPGLAPWSGTALVEALDSSDLDVVLGQGACVAGEVRDADEEPVAGALLQVGDYGRFASSMAWSAADGSFRLEGLAPGAIEVRALHESHGETAVLLDVLPGAEVFWKAVLRSRGSIAGRVVNARDEPLSSWMVGAIRPGELGLHLRHARTDADGRFLLESCPDGPLWIEVREPDDWSGDPALVVDDVAFGGPDVLLRIPAEALARALVRGRIIDWSGNPPVDGRGWLWSIATDEGESFDLDGRSGTFEVGPLRPGRYRLEFEAPGAGRTILPELELLGGEVREVGTVQLSRAGFLVVRVRPPEGLELPRSLWGRLSGAGLATAHLTFGEEEARSEPLAPGTYELEVRGRGVRGEPREVTVISGAEARVEVELVAATDRTLLLRLPDRAARRNPIQVVVLDASGQRYWDQELFPQPSGDPRLVVTGLLPGLYMVEARSGTAFFGSGSLHIDDLEPSSEEIEIQLR